MTSQTEQTLLILGASGDLAGRLLVPGLGDLVASGAVEGVDDLLSPVPTFDERHDVAVDRRRERTGEVRRSAGVDVEPASALAVQSMLESIALVRRHRGPTRLRRQAHRSIARFIHCSGEGCLCGCRARDER